MEEKLIGHVSVDSGQIIAVDPCYLKNWKDGEFADKDGKEDNHYNDCCNATLGEVQGGEVLVSGIAGNGVAFSTGYGDGNYPVYARYNDEGRVESVTIKFTD